MLTLYSLVRFLLHSAHLFDACTEPLQTGIRVATTDGSRRANPTRPTGQPSPPIFENVFVVETYHSRTAWWVGAGYGAACLSRCLLLGQVLNLFMLQFARLYKWDNNHTYLPAVLSELNELMYVKYTEECLVHVFTRSPLSIYLCSNPLVPQGH